ncbi:MAG: metalloregulator ArsR/SmtB family transcription factor [Thermoanaerobaculia bacterium]
MNTASDCYRLLGDEARLRMLRLLSRERLNVTELTAVLGLAQSGVSRHLKLLKAAGFIEEHKSGGFTYHSLADLRALGLGSLLTALLEQFEQAAHDPAVKADESRLREVHRLRRENFLEHSADARDNRQLVPGRSWAAWSRALGLLLPALRVADLGCGEGYLAIEASRWASTVLAVDRSETVLERARALAQRRRASNIVWKRGELERLPLKTGSVDVALLSQALHHALDPAKAVSEAVRIVAPGGRVLVLELRQHDEHWVRETLGDRTLGFSDPQLRQLLAGGGLTDIRLAVGASKAGDPFGVTIAVGQKAAPASPDPAGRKKRTS